MIKNTASHFEKKKKKRSHTSDHNWKEIEHLQEPGMQNFTQGRALKSYKFHCPLPFSFSNNID